MLCKYSSFICSNSEPLYDFAVIPSNSIKQGSYVVFLSKSYFLYDFLEFSSNHA